MPLAPLTAEQANAIYDVLVRHAGAADHSDGWTRNNFIAMQAGSNPPEEYRFFGGLGGGGKFWRYDEQWYVTAYPEDTQAQPQLWEVVNRTNAALAALRASYAEAA